MNTSDIHHASILIYSICVFLRWTARFHLHTRGGLGIFCCCHVEASKAQKEEEAGPGLSPDLKDHTLFGAFSYYLMDFDTVSGFFLVFSTNRA